MTIIRTSLAFALLCTPGVAPPAEATPEPRCAPATKVAEVLADKYDEVPRAIGLESRGHLIQVFATPDGKTWTIVATMPDGMSCILGAGTDWQSVMQVAGDPA